jgi:hypothetical protein
MDQATIHTLAETLASQLSSHLPMVLKSSVIAMNI